VRALTKPCELGVHDDGGAYNLSCARGSCIPVQEGGYVVVRATFYEQGFGVPSH
jgi:hypothetical protein